MGRVVTGGTVGCGLELSKGGNVRGQRLQGPAFRHPRVRTALPARDRLALSMVREEYGDSCQGTVRRVVEAGLTALGYTPQQRAKAYEEYVAEGVREELVNEFESR